MINVFPMNMPDGVWRYSHASRANTSSFRMNSNNFAAFWRLAKSLEEHAPGTRLGDFELMHRLTSMAGRTLHAKDWYGRSIGMVYWDIEPATVGAGSTAALRYVCAVPGRGPLLLAHLLARLADSGVQFISVPLRRRQVATAHKVFSVPRFLRKLPMPAERGDGHELHPVLVGQSAGPDADAVMAGAALYVLAQVPRLSLATARACVQLIDRAKGAGHLRVVYAGAEQQPVGVVVWARPRYADLGRLWQPKEVGRLHACELNMGGDMALLEYAVLHPNAVEGLLDVIRSELAQDGGGVHLALQRAGNGQAHGELVSIGSDDLPSFLDWFGRQLAAQVKQASC